MAKYFYAGGKRQPLDPADDLLAVDAGAAERAALPVISRLPGGLAIVDLRGRDPALTKELRSANARTVYRSGAVLVVPLPEVRVELEAGSLDQTLRAVDEAAVPSEVTAKTEERLALRPRSGTGEDALDLANYLCERAHPAAASVRLLQVVAKPLPPHK